jgi:NADH-quinone oxidoreductase subunit L
LETQTLDINSHLHLLTLLALLLPLISFIISLIIKDQYSWIVTLSAPIIMLVSVTCALIVSFSLWNEGTSLLKLNWFSISENSFSADLLLTRESLLMLSVVSIISFLVHLYSVGYMAGDAHPQRYFAMLGFFTFSMQGIVLADNLLLLFFFWELVGFSSYMLIGHWMKKPEAASAAKKAFVMNRIGDALFLIGLMIIWTNSESLSLSEIFSNHVTGSWQTAASLCIFCGVIGKSAQFPLFTWLPDAMEGPTPVSALIHAATMVAAGVYLLIRIFPLFSAEALVVVTLTGAVTAFIGSISALSQYDLKKILAYSTISQLGLMVMAIGMSSVSGALAHLFTHAFFKACLFLCAGNVIHSLHQAQFRGQHHFDVQDLRNLGGLRKKLPITFIAFLISGASLAGIPFFSGFLSKEAILVTLWNSPGMTGKFSVVTLALVSFLTVLYTFRMIWYVFMGVEKKTISLHVSEAPAIMRTPVLILAFASLWFMISVNPLNFTGWLIPGGNHLNVFWLSLSSILWVVAALATAFYFFRSKDLKTNQFLLNGFYINRAYQVVSTKLVNTGSDAVAYIDKNIIDRAIHFGAYIQITISHVTGWVDRNAIDGSVNGIARVAGGLGSVIRNFQSGKIQLYIFWAIFAIIIFLISILL